MIVAGVDIGASGIRSRVLDDGQVRQHEDASVPPAPGSHTYVDQLATLISSSLFSARPGLSDLSTIAVGLTGLPGLVRQPADLAAAISARVTVDRVVIASDSLITHIGALDTAAGTVIAAGTGAIALATDHQHTWHQADGWGTILGDGGGGAWIGRRGLRAALCAHDGRDGGSRHLLDGLADRFEDPQALLSQISADPAPGQLLASFAPHVAAAAKDGDPIAQGIWQQAGRQLAHTAAAAAKQLPPEPVSWGGGLFDAGSLLIDPFIGELEQLHPGVALCPPRGNAAGGALQLASNSRAQIGHAPYLYIYDTPDLNSGRISHRKDDQA